jgi:hypothetical protein
MSLSMRQLIFHSIEEFKDTKGVIKICKSKKNRQHNSQKKKDKRQKRPTKHTHKTKLDIKSFGLYTVCERRELAFIIVCGLE